MMLPITIYFITEYKYSKLVDFKQFYKSTNKINIQNLILKISYKNIKLIQNIIKSINE
jgi:hypothetical protein